MCIIKKCKMKHNFIDSKIYDAKQSLNKRFINKILQIKKTLELRCILNNVYEIASFFRYELT